jgi:hexokinase
MAPASSTKLSPTFKFDSAHHALPNATRRILNEIEQQFFLSDDRLLTITRQFVEDFSLGLGEYGKAMAMMYVRAIPSQRAVGMN